MKPEKKYNPHKWFFSYVTGLDGYNKNFDKVIREGIIMDFSNGLTGSLSELYKKYPDQYRRMKSEILKKEAEELDKARKRLIAALFEFLKEHKPTIQYVKGVACNAAGVSNFNDIPLNQLKSLYRTFGTKNTKGMNDIQRKVIWSVFRNDNRNQNTNILMN